MKKTLSLLIAILCASSAKAENAKVVVEPSKEGAPAQETALTVDTKITFTPTTVQIDNGGTQTSFTFADISQIRFITSTSGITPIMADGTYGLLRNPMETELVITGYQGSPAALSITSISGQTVYRNDSWPGDPVNVEALSPGAYILTINDTTLKFIKK